MSPLAGLLTMVTALTVGAVLVPFTLWLEAVEIAWLPRPRLALTLPLLMVPPFKVRALAAMSMPSASLSYAVTA